MKKIIFACLVVMLLSVTFVSAVNYDSALTDRLKGKLLLAVEDKGRIWYVNPMDSKRYEVTFVNALSLFQRFSLGINNADLESMPLPNTKTPIHKLAQRLNGRFLLQVQDKGRIWYISPFDYKRHEVTWANLMDLFRGLSIGITNENLNKIEIGENIYNNSRNFSFICPGDWSLGDNKDYGGQITSGECNKIYSGEYALDDGVRITFSFVPKDLADNYSYSDVQGNYSEMIFNDIRDESNAQLYVNSGFSGWISMKNQKHTMRLVARYQAGDGYYEVRADASGNTKTDQEFKTIIDNIIKTFYIKELSDWDKYSNDNYGFEFKYPIAWNLYENDSSGSDYKVIARVVNPSRAGEPDTDLPIEQFIIKIQNTTCSGQPITIDGQIGTNNDWSIGFGNIYYRDLCFETQGSPITILMSAFDESSKSTMDTILSTIKFNL